MALMLNKLECYLHSKCRGLSHVVVLVDMLPSSPSEQIDWTGKNGVRKTCVKKDGLKRHNAGGLQVVFLHVTRKRQTITVTAYS